MIGVGIIGASPGKSWAAQAHIPALAALPDLALRAVSTSSVDSAAAAAAAFGVPGFADHRALLDRADVDLAVVAVRVPTHLALVSDAIAAGKAVLCEWPLGNGTAEAVALAEAARAAGVRGFVGLQAQASPQVRALKHHVEAGYLGRLLSVSLVGSGLGWGAVNYAASAYTDDAACGATMLSIPIGHALDALALAIGEFDTLSASAAIGRRTVPLADTGETIERTTWDQIAVAGRIGEAVASVHYRGGSFPGTGLLLELIGTEGTLQLVGPGGHLQMTSPTLLGARGEAALAELPLPEDARWVPAGVPDGVAFNVGQNYALVARDLAEGTRLAPDFDHAVRRHRMLDAIEQAIVTGERVSL